MTGYVILACPPEPGDAYRPVATVQAHTPDAAIRAHAADVSAIAAKGTLFVAVPERHWKPRRITVEMQTRVTVEEAT